MKKRLSKLALLAVAAAFIVAGFPACSDDDEDGEPPAQASATFALAEDETAIELTETSPTEVNATLTVTNGAFSDAVKALEVNASLADYLTVSAGEKVTAVAKLAEKVTGNVMKVTLTVTAETGADGGEITAAIKAPALTTVKELAATGAISYTVTPLPATAPQAELQGDTVEVTKGKTESTAATITLTKGAFDDAVKALEVNASLADYLTVSADGKVTAVASLAEKVTGNTMKITLAVTAAEDAAVGDCSISVTIKADALADYDQAIAANGAVPCTVKAAAGTEVPDDPPADEVSAALTCTIDALAEGEAKTVSATVTLTNDTFSDAVKALEVDASLADYLTVSVGEKVTAVAKLAEKVTGNVMKITLTVTAETGAKAGEISMTVKAAALKDSSESIETQKVGYTVTAAQGGEKPENPDDPPAEENAEATVAGGDIEVTAGETANGSATITLTKGAFSDEVKALDANASLADYLTLPTGDDITISDVKLAEKVNGSTMKIAFTLTAGEEAATGTITATLKAAAVTSDNDVDVTGAVNYTVKEKVVEPPETVYTLTEASATISLGKKNVGTIASKPNAGGKAYLSAATDNWNSSATVGDFTDEFYNLSESSRSLTLTVKNVAGFKLYVKSSNADRTFTVKIGDNDTVTITHPGKQTIDGTQTDVIPFIFNTGTTEEVAIVIGGDGGSVYPAYVVLYDTAQDIPVERVEITGVPTGAVLLADGTVRLGATVSPARATDKQLTWTSSEDSIATVDSTGLVTLKAAGTVTVKAEAASGANAEAEIVIQAASVAVTGITLNKNATTITRWGTESLEATISPENASDKTLEWTSSDENVAQVKDGVVSAIAAGTATVTAKSAANSAISVTCEVTVTPAIVSENFAISKEDYNSNALTGKLLSNNMYTTAKVDSNGIYCHRKISANGYTQFELDSPKIVTITYNVSSMKETGLVISTSDGDFSVPEGSSVKIAGETENKPLNDVLGTDSGSDTNTKAAYTSVTSTSSSKTEYKYLIQLTAGTYKLYGSTTNTSAKASSIVFTEPAS